MLLSIRLKITIKSINDNFSSDMYKCLFLVNNFVYKACNPTILNLSINQRKYEFRVVGY